MHCVDNFAHKHTTAPELLRVAQRRALRLTYVSFSRLIVESAWWLKNFKMQWVRAEFRLTSESKLLPRTANCY